MANWMKILGQIVLAAFCFYTIALESVEARGGRGGGRGGRFGARSFRSSRAYRSSRITRMSTTRKAIIAGTIFGAASYRRRRRYLSNPDSDPAVCHNSQYVGNGTVYYYGKFICPLDGQSDDMAYCCGAEGSQRCCEFFDDPGRTAGVVIGVLIGAVVIAAVIFFCVCKQMKNKSPGQVISSFRNRGRHDRPGDSRGKYSGAPTQGYAVGYSAPPPAPQTNMYPVQPVKTPLEQNGTMPPPPPYDNATGNQNLPYGLNPDPGYKQPLPTGDYSTDGQTPYPMNPTAPGTDYSQNPPYPGSQPYPQPPPGQDMGYAPQPYPPPAGGYPSYGQQ